MVGASGARPNMGVRLDAPTIETIVLLTFHEIIKFVSYEFSFLKKYSLKIPPGLPLPKGGEFF